MSRRLAPPFVPEALVLALALTGAGPAAAEPVMVPGGTASIRRLLALDPRLPEGSFFLDLHRDLLAGGRATAEGGARRKAVVAFVEDLAEWRAEIGCPARLSAREGSWKKTRRALEWLGFRVHGAGPGFTAELRADDDAKRRRAFLEALGASATATLEALAAGEEATIACEDGVADLPYSLGAWREVLDLDEKSLNAGSAFLHFARSVPASRMLVALGSLDPRTREELRAITGPPGGAGGWKLVFDEGLDAFARFPEALRLRDGRVLLPGGPAADAAWADVLGESPADAALFVERLFSAGSGKGAYVVDALRQRPEDVARAFVLGRTGGGERAVERFRALYASIENAGGSPGRPVRDPFDFWHVSWFLRSGKDGDLEVPGGAAVWLEALSGSSFPEDEAELRRLVEESAAREGGADELLVRVFRDAASGTVATATARTRWALVSSLLEARPVLAEPGTILLLWRGFERLFPACAPLESLPLDDPGAARRFLFTMHRLETGGRGRDAELRAGLLQASVELLAVLARSGALPDARARELFSSLLDLPLFATRGVAPHEGIADLDRWLRSGLLAALGESEAADLAARREGPAAGDDLDAPRSAPTPDDLVFAAAGGFRAPVRFDFRGGRYEWDATADGAGRRRALAATQEHVPLAALAEATAAREKAVTAAAAGDAPGVRAAVASLLEHLDAARLPGRGDDERVGLVAANARVGVGELRSATAADVRTRLEATLERLDALRAERTLEALEVHLYAAAAGEPSDLVFSDPLLARRHGLSWATPAGAPPRSPFGPTRLEPAAEGRSLSVAGSFSGLAPVLGLLHAEELVYEARASLPNDQVRAGLVGSVALVTPARLDGDAVRFVDLACRAAEQLAAALADGSEAERADAWGEAARGLVPASRRSTLAAEPRSAATELSPSDLFLVGRRLALAGPAPDGRAPAAAEARSAWASLVQRHGEAGAAARVAELGPRASAWAGSSRLSDRELPAYERLAEYRIPHLFADRLFDLKVSAARALVRDGDPAALLGLTLPALLDEQLRRAQMRSPWDWRALVAVPELLGREGRDRLLAEALASGRIARVDAPKAR